MVFWPPAKRRASWIWAPTPRTIVQNQSKTPLWMWLHMAPHGSTWLHLSLPSCACRMLQHTYWDKFREFFAWRKGSSLGCGFWWLDLVVCFWCEIYRDPKCSAAGMARVSPCPFFFPFSNQQSNPSSFVTKETHISSYNPVCRWTTTPRQPWRNITFLLLFLSSWRFGVLGG